MVKASEGVADATRTCFAPDSDELIVAFVGGGDNGGDALYAAAFLSLDGYEVEAMLLTDHPHERGLETARMAGVRMFNCEDDTADQVVELAKRGTLWIDGMVGTGVQGQLREPFEALLPAWKNTDSSRTANFKGPTGESVYKPGEAPRTSFQSADLHSPCCSD